MNHRGGGQVAVRALHKVGGAAQFAHHAGEDFCGRAGGERFVQLGKGFFAVSHQFARHQHLDGEFAGDLHHAAVGALAAQQRQGFDDLHRVTGTRGQWLAHVGEQGGGGCACLGGHVGDTFRQLAGFFRGGHKRAAAYFDVHHQGIQARGQLLAQNRRGDQRNRFHSGGHVAHAVDALIRRGEVAGLADNRHTGGFYDIAEALGRGVGVVAGD